MNTDKPDLWNRLLEISNNHKNPDVKHHAKLLLGQYNTASGGMMKNEIISFLEKHDTPTNPLTHH